MSRNIPRAIRHKHGTAPRRAIPHDVSTMVLRTGAILIWCGCLALIGVVAAQLSQNTGAGQGHGLWQAVALAAACAGAFVVGWRLWVLKRWAGIAAVVMAWLFSLGEPWRPALEPGAQVDVLAALGVSAMISVFVAIPLTVAWVFEHSRLKPGF
jgi:hypothetical protein